MSNETIDFRRIARESRETLFNTKEYFSSMSLEGGYAEPVIKAAIYGTVAGLFSLLWSVTGLYNYDFGFMDGLLGIMALVWSIVGAIVGVFIGGALMLLVSAICGGNTDYEANVRVAASLMVVYPINVFFAFLNGISITLGSMAGLVISLYSITLIYYAAIHALKGKESSVRIVAIVMVVLAMIGAIGSYKASKTIENMDDMYEREQLD